MKSDDGVNLAYQVVGEEPVDLIVVPGYVPHLETWWEARSGDRAPLGVILAADPLLDKRGDGPVGPTTGEVDVHHWIEDGEGGARHGRLGAAAVLGLTAGGLIADVPFAATYPARVRALVLYGAFARQTCAGTDYPIGLRPEDVDAAHRVHGAQMGFGL